VPPGDPLIEIGDPHRLEIVVDLLSTDAVRVQRGARTIIEQWGGERQLEARVRRIEPSGFAKISALGVEEQRVNVVLDFVDPAAAWAALGDAYRVEVRIVIWEAAAVQQVPTSALFRQGEKWAAYTVAEGRARRVIVELGHQTGQEAEVVSGLAEGAPVILHPVDTLADGAVDAFAVDHPIYYWACTAPESRWRGRIEILPGNLASAPWHYAVGVKAEPASFRLLAKVNEFIRWFATHPERLAIERTWQGNLLMSNRSYRDEPGHLLGEPELFELYRQHQATIP
jgi:hypothetical protein